MSYLFWLSAAALFIAYLGYPLFLWLAGRLLKRGVAKNEFFPFVTIVIAAHNEEDCVAETIENKLALDYPKEKQEIIVVSDGSTDKTEEIVERYKKRGVKLIAQSPRAGKTAALNKGARAASGEIVVFSDANSIYHPEALRKLARNFSDPQVGYVTGQMVYVDEHGSLVGKGCGAYMRYENVLRELETRVGSIVGVDGGIDAIRKELYTPMREDLLPDFVLPLWVIQKGHRVVYEKEALLMEKTLTATEDEWRMRIRVIVRSFRALWFMRSLFNPFRVGLFSIQLFLHKPLRYLAGLFQMFLFLSNMFLLGGPPFYAFLFWAQTLFYFLSAAGFLLRQHERRGRLLGYATYFCLLNAASLWAFWKFLKGEKHVIWQPRKGH